MSRARADFVLDSIGAQVERVKNNGARRRLRKALEAAKAKRARTLEIEAVRRADRARTLTVDGPPVGILSLAHDLAVQRSGKMERFRAHVASSVLEAMRRREEAQRAAGLLGIGPTAAEVR